MIYKAYRVINRNEISLTPMTTVVADSWVDAERLIEAELRKGGRSLYFNEWHRTGRLIGICMPGEPPYRLRYLHAANALTTIAGLTN